MEKDKAFNPGSANFEAYYLEVTPEYIKVKPSKKLLVFYSIFAIIGVALPVVIFFAERDSDAPIIQVVIFGAIFFLIGAGMMSVALLRRYPCIDLRQRIFYPRGKREGALPDMSSAIPLSEAREIEISSRHVHSKNNSYTCYSLFLNFYGNRRFTMLNHGNLKAFMRDARLLSQYTGLPLPQEEDEISENERKKAHLYNLKAAPFLLVFGLVWTLLSLVLHCGAWIASDDWFPIAFSGFFVLIGVSILIFAVRLIIERLRK
ncbi:MAG: hypothetical protein IJC27_09040 [Lentisphaeria bacterium]|nr:hypothetical protein [Lentisphaeria bacterium]